MPTRLPPHDLGAERAVLGCILWDPQVCLPQCEALLPADWAYDLRHQLLYGVMRELFAGFKPVDVVTLTGRLRDDGQLDRIGGEAWLMGLQDDVPSAANLPSYLATVREKHSLRTLVRVCSEVIGAVYAPDAEAMEVFNGGLARLESVTVSEQPQREKHIKTILPRVLNEMEKYHRGRAQLHGLPTGISYLDKVVQGIDETHYMVIAGRPGDGKSTLAMNIVEHLALDYEWWEPCSEADAADHNAAGRRTAKAEDGTISVQRRGIPVGVFSLEMNDESLVKRMLFARKGADMGRWNTGMANAEDWTKLTVGAGQLVKGSIYIDDLSDQTIGKIRARARRMVKDHGIKLFVLDYIQLLDVDDDKLRADRVRELTKISKSIVSLKKQLKVPWLVLAQMNRNIETSDSKSRDPVLSDLKDCGALEQDADVVLFLHKPRGKDRDEDKNLLDEHFADDWTQKPVLVDAMVAKNRFGPTGRAQMLFWKNMARFMDFREWKVREGLQGPALGESYKPKPETTDLPSNEEMDL